MMDAIFGTRVHLCAETFQHSLNPVCGTQSTRMSDDKRYPGPHEVRTCESGVSSRTRWLGWWGEP